jgi:Resolvase, N terminal domain
VNFQPVSKSKAGESEALIFTKVDTRTPMGKAMAHMAVVFAELERDLIRMRTRGRCRSRRRTASRLADQDRRQTTCGCRSSGSDKTMTMASELVILPEASSVILDNGFSLLM